MNDWLEVYLIGAGCFLFIAVFICLLALSAFTTAEYDVHRKQARENLDLGLFWALCALVWPLAVAGLVFYALPRWLFRSVKAVWEFDRA